MTLQEWVEKLSPNHRARKQYDSLLKENKGQQDEGYPKDWVHIDLMISPDGKEVHAIGGDRVQDPGTVIFDKKDIPFKGLPLLKKHYVMKALSEELRKNM